MDREELEGQSHSEGCPEVRIFLAPLVSGITPTQLGWGE